MIKHIGVVGAGQMGAGIALVATQNNFNVSIFEPLELSQNKAQAYFQKKLPDYKPHFVTELTALSHCDLVIEAIPEQEDLKKKFFQELDLIAKPEAILASNTSSISITKIAAATKNPERVIGMHFMNPVPVMKLVELIRGLQTSENTYQAIKTTAEKMGKTTTTSKDYPGFIANRILMPMINEAFYALQEGLASAEDIDTTLKLGANHPMGPLTLADFIGLDTCKSILEIMDKKPCVLLNQYVDAGWLGKKSGRGVFSYV
ncbi:MAG: 3-hydroxyacyl-CoA dehydrogenase NAD-binding domain-containing protein [Myxococcaceae bacterium]